MHIRVAGSLLARQRQGEITLRPSAARLQNRGTVVWNLEAHDDVRLYLKLPYWFTVPTLVGEYRPDWAIVMDGLEQDGEPVLYFGRGPRIHPPG